MFDETHVFTAGSCPSNCTCGVDSVARLNIDCQNRTLESSYNLSAEIDELLHNNKMNNLSILVITNSPLVDVPSSVCNMTQLTELYLDYNKLTRLPNDCLRRLTKLANLSAIGNKITELQDGLFDGLRKLTNIYLQQNKIASIGLNVFSNLSNHEINTVNLSRNSLQTLDTWPFSLASNQLKQARRISIFLDYNYISNFSNRIGWQFNCNKTLFHMRLFLGHNNVLHVTDMTKGWSLTTEDFLKMINTVQGCERRAVLMLHLELSGNPLDCNCQDFDVYKALKTREYYPIFDSTLCNSPPYLRRQAIKLIDLSKFVCNVSERCPAECTCTYIPNNLMILVNCSRTNMYDIPRELPDLPDALTTYRLDFSRNPLGRFEAEPYFANVSSIDASRCAINTISFTSWEILLRTPTLFLNGNQLRSLPKELKNITVTSKRVHLGYNPWNCSCANAWMKRWMMNHVAMLVNSQTMWCKTPQWLHNKSIAQVPDEDFCSDPMVRMWRKFAIVAGCFVVIIAAIVVIAGPVAYRLRYRMFARWRFHPFDRDECIGEEMDYDVFLSCSSKDLSDARSIISQLEDNGYKVCFHERDFEVGETIDNNIVRAIERSKRTLCVVTSHFVRR
jgi:TIR domain/Leucine rich repeat